jgi:hypothetical protein
VSHDLAHGADHETFLAIAALVLIGGGAIFLILSFRARHSAGSAMEAWAAEQARDVDTDVARDVASMLAALSMGAAVIHLAAAPSHYLELGDLGTGFVVAAAFQAGWAVAARGPALTRRIAWLGLIGDSAIVIAWAWTRTLGLPVGHGAGSPEPIGLPDAVATAFEVLIVGALLMRLTGAGQRLARRFPPARTLVPLTVIPVVGLCLVMTSLAAVAIASGQDHGQVGAEHRTATHAFAGGPEGR